MTPNPRPDAGCAPSMLEHPGRASDFATLLDARLRLAGFAATGTDPLRDALVHIGARYGEILAQRLEAAPELHRRFLVDRLGTRPGAALPARVLLSFQPGTAPAGPAAVPLVVVPARTPVAAPPAPGELDPVVFETLDDLELVRAQAVRAVAVDPRRGTWADLPALLTAEGKLDTDLFAAAGPLESTFRLAAPEVFDIPGLRRLEVCFDIERDAASLATPIAAQWGVPSADGFTPLEVERDGTGGLTTSGTVVLTPPAHWPSTTIDGIATRWLACRAPPAGPGSALRIGHLRVSGQAWLEGATVDDARFGALPLDTSRDFLPLGERPRFNDVFQFTTPAIALPGARVTLTVRLTNPAGAAEAPLPPVDADGAPGLRWEISATGATGWRVLDVEDDTGGLTRHGDIAFTVPTDDAPPQGDAGQPGAAVRARLVGGHYGAPRMVGGLLVQPAPSIESLHWRASVACGPVAPRHLGRQGWLVSTPLDAGPTAFLVPFPAADTAGPVLYLGLMSRERSLAGRKLSVQVEPGALPGRRVRRSSAPDGVVPAPTWQRRTTDGWRDGSIVDGSAGLTRPGIVAIDLGDGLTAWEGSTLDPAGRLVWLRVVWPAEAPPPHLRVLALNAVRATQALRLENEVLGTGDGRPGQVFMTLRSPVVGEPLLQLREDPAAADARAWVAWERVADFAGSAADARHFTLDAATGRIAFGDGRHGRIPPTGAGNVRLRRYDTGGGRRGNRPAGQVTQLRTTVPYVDAVRQRAPATGGQDGDDAATVRDAAGAWLRHRDRAIAADDYADLARAASREVARAWCRAGRDLDGAAAAVPDAPAPGVVSVVIVPTGDEARPQPAPDLLDRVTAYLDARRSVTADLVVLGPAYAAVSVEARIACAGAAAARGVAAACRQRLAAFLHPVHGAADGRGWAPGRRPHRSDLLAVLGAVEGVDHVASLTLRIEEPADAAREATIVCAGVLEVTTP